MKPNPLLRIPGFSQSIWVDFISRGMLLSGELGKFIQQDGILGMTSNPSIFEDAITGSHDYDNAIRAAALKGCSAQEIYGLLTISDIQAAADIFRQTYEDTEGKDGFVSFEVSPHLARDTEGTVAEARRLWGLVARGNLLIKVPATAEGIPAIRRLISEGINVNVTLLFSLERYAEVTEAYLSGLEERIRGKQSISGITSVASFFLSRIDSAVDRLLPRASELRGKTAIASAKVAFHDYRKIFGSDRFERLKNLGGKRQRILWASTGTKDSSQSDIKYVDALIGPETIDTAPLKTLEAYRDHGNPQSRLEQDLSRAHITLAKLAQEHIDLRKVTSDLEAAGVKKFSLAFDSLISALEKMRTEFRAAA